MLKQQLYNINIYIIIYIFIVHMFAFNIFYMKYIMRFTFLIHL